MAALPAAMTHGNGSKSQRRGWAGLATSLATNLLGDLLLKAVAAPAMAQRAVPKLGNCSTLGLMSYTLTPTHGKSCLSGWMNVEGRYCRRQ